MSLSPAGLRVLLGVLIFVAFSPFLVADLFWDDYLVIREDGPIASLSTLNTVFFGRCVLFSEEYEYPYYRPLIDALFVIEYAIAGTSPFLYHLTNFLLHLGNGLLLFELLRRVKILGLGDAGAFFGTALFALHPIQVESVLWPAARPAVLSLFFGLLAAHGVRALYSAGCMKRGSLLGFLAVMGFTASLLSKEIAVALLPPATLLFLARGEKFPRRIYVVAGLLFLVLAVYLLANSAVSGSASQLGEAGPAGVVELVFQFFGFYLAKIAFPLNLAPAYPAAVRDSIVYTIIGCLGTLICLAIFAWGIVKRSGPTLAAAGAAALFGGGAVLPVFGGQVAVADRYVYQAMVGLGVLCGFGVSILLARKPSSTKVVFGVMILLAVLTLRQSSFWMNSNLVWLHVVAVSPGSLEGNYYVAKFHEERGELETAARYFEAAAFPDPPTTAIAQFDAAMALGGVYLSLGEHDKAIAAFAHAEQFPPLRNDAIVRQAVVEATRGNREAAHEILARFADSGSERPGVYTNLALLSLRMDDDPESAARWYEKARQRGASPIEELEQLSVGVSP